MSEIVTDIANAEMAGKKWWMSRTLWTNIIFAGSAYALTSFGVFITPDMQVMALAGVNVLLRTITKEPVVW